MVSTLCLRFKLVNTLKTFNWLVKHSYLRLNGLAIKSPKQLISKFDILAFTPKEKKTRNFGQYKL